MYRKRKKFWILLGVLVCVIAVIAIATVAILVWRAPRVSEEHAPELWLKIVTDKKTYAQRENVTYWIFIVNNMTENFTFTSPGHTVDFYKRENGEDKYLYLMLSIL